MARGLEVDISLEPSGLAAGSLGHGGEEPARIRRDRQTVTLSAGPHAPPAFVVLHFGGRGRLEPGARR